MKKYIFTVVSVIVLNITFGYCQDTLTILHLNDTHSNLSSLGPRDPVSLEGTQGGIARAAAYINSIRQSASHTMVLHAGDSFIGDMFFNATYGIGEFTLLKELGVDAFTLGNHEFDLGTPTLANAYDTAMSTGTPIPLLSANFILNSPSLEEFGDTVQSYIIKDYGSYKVGIFGLTTPETNLLSLIKPDSIDVDFVGIAANVVAELQAAGCSVIILLSHLGVEYDSLVAGNVPGIDIIVGGHDHYIFNQPLEITNPGGTITYIVQAGSFYRYIGKMVLEINQGNVAMLDYQLVPMDNNIPEDPAFLQAVNDMVDDIESDYGPIYTQQIAEATGYFEEVADSLTVPGNHDTPAGNLITDAFRITMGTDIALEAGGSIAQPIYQGPLTAIDLFRTVGYGFNLHNGLGYPLATFELTGAEIWMGLEICMTMLDSKDEFLPQVSGMSYKYNLSLPEFSRVYEVLVNGIPIDPYATYSITANQFMAAIMQQQFGFILQNYQEYPDSTEFQVLSSYVSALGSITPETGGRIYTRVKETTFNAPKEFQLIQNFPNPFNPSTEIRYQIPEPGFVTLKIYDTLGREIKSLVNEYKASGSYSVKWNASTAASGVYFYTLQSGGRKITKKMILLR